MKKNILLIGINENITKELSKYFRVFAIEEVELFRLRYSDGKPDSVIDVKFGAYQQSIEAVDAATAWAKEVDFMAILPGREYAVFATNAVANALEKPRAGDLAARCLSNKFVMREYLAKEKIINQPEFARITQFDELVAFFLKNSKQPIVLKPSNRQSSVGVIKIFSDKDLNAAWNETRHAEERGQVVTKRSQHWEYQVEAMLSGPEFSVESFVSKGETVFQNITRKVTGKGIYPVELGHLVPSGIDEDLEAALLSAQSKLVTTLQVNAAALHSEWILQDGQPALVECAGRAPGDYIPELISNAWGFSYYRAFAEVMMGLKPELPKNNVAFSGITYFSEPSGRVISTQPFESLLKVEGVTRGSLTYKVGDIIPPLRNNWERSGFLIVKGEQYNTVENLVLSLGAKEPYVIDSSN